MSAIADLVADTLARAREQPLPESTYRLQFHAGFTFRDALCVLPYLSELGVTHVYASPYLKARAGSAHGYDVVDHRSLNPEIGTIEDHDAFIAALRQHGLRLILDIVPNHMGIDSNENLWWDDVLENGPSSPYAGYFDIAWKDTARPELKDKVLLPVLGEPYGIVLDAGQLRLEFEGGKFVLAYFSRKLPVAPRGYALILSHRLEELGQLLGADSPDFAEYQSILSAIGHLPDRTETEPPRVAERQREKEIVKRRLNDLCAHNGTVRGFIEENVLAINGTPGIPRSFDLMDDLLNHQCYRLSFWRVALEEINYRRFFDVNELAAICVEREDVFIAVHELIFRLLGEGKADGVRIDHPDGLYDPHQYFQRLQRQYLLALARGIFESDPTHAGMTTWNEIAGDVTTQFEAIVATPGARPRQWPLYAVAEKILAADEPVPNDWAVSGGVGYEFIRAVTGLFVDESAESAFNKLYREIDPNVPTFTEVLNRSKRLILSASLAAELNMLAYQLDRLAQKNRRSRDFTWNGLRDALREIIACFPVYRSYLSDRDVSARDRDMVETAVRVAAHRNPLMSRSVLRFVGDTIQLIYPEGASEADRAEQRRFTGRFQQLTSPVMAKGLEDTTFYVYNRLLSLNEVGGSPEWPRHGPETLHRFNAERQARWPYALTPLSTHDTKRSEDVRARLNVLSELPEEWAETVRRWYLMNAAHRKRLDENPVPDANEEYLIYQTLLGAWPPRTDSPGPDLVERIKAYVVKALREAKVHSSWLNPNTQYDDAVLDFVSRLLDAEIGREFLDDFLRFQKRVAWYGAVNSLAQTLLKLTVPGVADTYQGTEIPDFSLVDPDNRRPVDYALRRKMLDDLRERVLASPGDVAAFAHELSETLEDGRAKLYVMWRLLHLRQENPGLFAEGEYLPLTGCGPRAENLFAFARRWNGVTAVVAVPRLSTRLSPDAGRPPLGAAVWSDTRLILSDAEPDGPWVNAFTQKRVTSVHGDLSAADLFAEFPAALLLR